MSSIFSMLFCEMLTVDDEDNNLIKVLLTIGAHWSPLELEIEDEDDNNLIKKLLSIGAHWSWRIQMGSLFSVVFTIGAHWSPL